MSGDNKIIEFHRRRLKDRLVEEYNNSGSLCSSRIVGISEELDKVILQLMMAR